MDKKQYIDLIFEATLGKEEPSMDALDEAIAIVALAIKNLKSEETKDSDSSKEN